jgi:hypothetical protein
LFTQVFFKIDARWDIGIYKKALRPENVLQFTADAMRRAGRILTSVTNEYPPRHARPRKGLIDNNYIPGQLNYGRIKIAELRPAVIRPKRFIG